MSNPFASEQQRRSNGPVNPFAAAQRTRKQEKDFSDRAAGMDAVALSVARAKNDAFGKYLRNEALKTREGETAEQRSVRLGGQISTPKVGTGEGIARSVLQGALMAYGDEAVAAGAAALEAGVRGGDYDKAYQTLLGRERGKLGQFRKQSPITSTVAEIGGAIPTALAAPGAAIGATGSLPARIGGGALAGGVFGGIYGSGSSEADNLEGRLADSKDEAALGAGLGVAAPLIGSAFRNVFGHFMNKAQAKAAGISPTTYEVLRRALNADEALSGGGAERIRAAGPDAMLADAGNALRTQLDAAIQSSGRAGNIALKNIGDRVRTTGGKLTSALDDIMGVPGQPMTREYGRAVNEAYEKAYSTPINYADEVGMEIQSLLERVPGDALRRAQQLMKVEGVRDQSQQIMARIADDGSVIYERLPNIRQLDYITRGLNAAAKSTDNAGALGGATDVSRAYKSLSGEIRNAAKRAAPDYAQALNLSAGKIREREAQDFGATLLASRTTRQDVTEALANASDAEKRAMKQGVRQYIDDMMANVKAVASDPETDVREIGKLFQSLSSRASVEKITTLLGTRDASRVLKELDGVSKAVNLQASVARNSATAQRTATREAVQDIVGDSVLDAARDARPVEVLQRAAKLATGGSAGRKSAAEQQIYDELAEYLTGRQGLDAEAAAALIERMAPRLEDQITRLGIIGDRSTRGAAGNVAGQIKR